MAVESDVGRRARRDPTDGVGVGRGLAVLQACSEPPPPLPGASRPTEKCVTRGRRKAKRFFFFFEHFPFKGRGQRSLRKKPASGGRWFVGAVSWPCCGPALPVRRRTPAPRVPLCAPAPPGPAPRLWPRPLFFSLGSFPAAAAAARFPPRTRQSEETTAAILFVCERRREGEREPEAERTGRARGRAAQRDPGARPGDGESSEEPSRPPSAFSLLFSLSFPPPFFLFFISSYLISPLASFLSPLPLRPLRRTPRQRRPPSARQGQ